MAKQAGWVGVIGVAIAAGFPIIAAAFHPGYDHASQFISELGARGAPNAALVNYAGFLPAGVLLTLFPLLAWRALPRAVLTTLALTGVALFSVGYIAATFYPCDAGCRPSDASTSQALHNLLGLAGYLTAPGVLFALGWQARRWPQARVVSMIGFVGALAALIGLATFAPEFAYVRVSQRLIEGGMLAWMLAAALYLLRAQE